MPRPRRRRRTAPGAHVGDHAFVTAVEHDLEGVVHRLPVDPDVLREEARALPPPRLRDVVRDHGDLLAVIAVGGAIGSLGRYGVAELVPHDAGAFAWSTFAVNVSGALLLGVLMALMADVLAGTRYVRPLLGVGVLGGWTTFSTYALDARATLAEGRVALALLYLALTVVVGLAAVWLGLVAGRTAVVVAGRSGRHRTAGRPR